jgi:hypothetical protein
MGNTFFMIFISLKNVLYYFEATSGHSLNIEAFVLCRSDPTNVKIENCRT